MLIVCAELVFGLLTTDAHDLLLMDVLEKLLTDFDASLSKGSTCWKMIGELNRISGLYSGGILLNTFLHLSW